MVTQKKGDWVITEEAFNKLLEHFDEDREEAGEKYEQLRRGLTKFFECRGCFAPADYADETFNRVARRISEGQDVAIGAIQGYCYGVARNVARERHRNPEVQASTLDSLLPSDHPRENPSLTERQHGERIRTEQRMECLEMCLDELPPESRFLIESYHEGRERAKIRNHERLAEMLGITINNLRVRVHRIRKDLERCVLECATSFTGDLDRLFY